MFFKLQKDGKINDHIVKINELSNIVEYAVNNIKSDAEDGVTHKEFAEKNPDAHIFTCENCYK